MILSSQAPVNYSQEKFSFGREREKKRLEENFKLSQFKLLKLNSPTLPLDCSSRGRQCHVSRFTEKNLKPSNSDPFCLLPWYTQSPASSSCRWMIGLSFSFQFSTIESFNRRVFKIHILWCVCVVVVVTHNTGWFVRITRERSLFKHVKAYFKLSRLCCLRRLRRLLLLLCQRVGLVYGNFPIKNITYTTIDH